MLTAYDYPTARLLDAAGVDCLLVGDSMGTTVQGRDTTLAVTLDQMIYHAEMVARAAGGRWSWPTCRSSPTRSRRARRSAPRGRVLKETNCQAVKLEGGRRMAATIKALVEAEIPVMGHVGLTPQSIRRLGSYKVQRAEDVLRADAQAVAEAGAFAVVLECVPAELAATDHGGTADPDHRHRRGPRLRRPGACPPRHARPARGLPPQVRPPLRRARRADQHRRRELRAGRPERHVPRRGESFR